MGIHNLFGFCLAVFSVSALAADPPVPRGNVSATVNPTTGYYSSTNSTFRLPNGVSTSPSSTSVPVVSKYSGGLQQTIPTGITIDAIKKSASLPATVRAGNPALKTAAKGLLRGNVAGLALGAGLTALLASVDWVIDEGGNLQKSSIDNVPPSDPRVTYVGSSYDWVNSRVGNVGEKYNGLFIVHVQTSRTYFCASVNEFYNIGGIKTSDIPLKVECSYSKIDNPPAYSPVASSEISDAVDSSYVPEPSDWTNLTPHLNLDEVEITSAPTLSSNPKTTTIYDAAGNPVEVQETNIWYDFDIRDNPSPFPALDLKSRQETKTYKNGALTGTTTTTDTDSAGTATGGGGGSNVNIDIPTDCEFMPTVCAFLDWFKNDDTPEDPDLSALIDNRDFTETYSITGGSEQCPADYEFTVDFIGRTYGLSFEPACDFASKMYYFVMAAAYIFAAYITIGASRNG